MNSFINAQLATKKLRLGAKKCSIIHVGNKHEEYKHVPLYVDGWSVKTVESYETKEVIREDTIDEDMKEISHLESERYLGQILSSDSKNSKNISKLRNKGFGIKNKIVSILSNIPGGQHHFELAMVYRSAYLLSSILSNSEVWYGATNADIDLLEQLDESLLREIVECSRNAPKDLLYLELGIIPISYVIKIRRQMFLHHILHQKEDSLLFHFFMAQMRNPTKGDWVTSILEDIEDLEIGLDLEEVKNMSKNQFKKIVKEKVAQKALFFLVKKK